MEIFVPGLHMLRSKPWRLVLLNYLGFRLNNYFLLLWMHLYVCVCVYIFLLLKNFFPLLPLRPTFCWVSALGCYRRECEVRLVCRWGDPGSTQEQWRSGRWIRSHLRCFILCINLTCTAYNLFLLLKSYMNKNLNSLFLDWKKEGIPLLVRSLSISEAGI